MEVVEPLVESLNWKGACSEKNLNVKRHFTTHT